MTVTEHLSRNSFRTGPDERGHFGLYGGRFVAETLMPLILELEQAYSKAKADPKFQQEMDGHLATYVGRPSPLYFAERLTQHCGGAKIYFKREELNHTGAHKVNNVLGQIMLARRMGKTRIIAETGAGMHGVATATLCAKFGLPCIVYMGSVDIERQQPNVLRMKILGAEVRAVELGSKTLKDAMNEALRDWVANVHDTFYCIGTVAGPHPYPAMVRDFQSIIGRETREQMLAAEGRLPDFAGRLHRRRLKCHGPVPSLPRRARHRDLWRGGGRPWPREWQARGLDRRRPAGRAARQPHLSLAGRRRSDLGGAFDLGRPRLSRHRPRAFLAAGCGAGAIPLGDRRRSAERLPALHASSKASSRRSSRAHALANVMELAPDQAARTSDGDQCVRPRRQGLGERRKIFGRGFRLGRAPLTCSNCAT